MSGFVLRDSRINSRALAKVAVDGVVSRMFGRAIVGVDYVASAASAGAVVSGLIIRSREREQRIQQPRFLQTQKGGIGAQQGSEAALTQFHVGLTWFLFEVWDSYLRLLFATTFENAQDVTGLRNFPALNRLKKGKHSLGASFFRRGRREGLQSLRRAIRRVALAEMRILERDGSIVIKRRAPQHGTVGHHTCAYALHFRCMASRASASLLGHSQISRIHKLDVVCVLFQPFGVGANRIGGTVGTVGKTRPRVRLPCKILILR